MKRPSSSRLTVSLRQRSSADDPKLLKFIGELLHRLDTEEKRKAVLSALDQLESQPSSDNLMKRLLETLEEHPDRSEEAAPAFDEPLEEHPGFGKEHLETDVREAVSRKLDQNKDEFSADESGGHVATVFAEEPTDSPASESSTAPEASAEALAPTAAPTLEDVRKDVAAAVKSVVRYLAERTKHGWRFTCRWISDIGDKASGNDLETPGEGD